MHDLTGATRDYSIRQAAYDLRKLRGKQLVDKPGRTRRYQVRHPPHAPSPPCSPSATRSSPRSSPGAQPAHGTQTRALTHVDRDYERIRIDMQTLINDLAIETPPAA